MNGESSLAVFSVSLNVLNEDGMFAQYSLRLVRKTGVGFHFDHLLVVPLVVQYQV